MASRSSDPFDVLGLPATFALTPQQIERAYLARARRLHPDLASGGEAGSDAAHAGSAELNRAAQVLRDPESRAGALLTRLGGPDKETDRSLPDGFLASMLETRMEVEASKADPAERARWESWARDQRAAYSARCAELFGLPQSPPDEARRREIRRTLNAWRYIERLIEQLEPGYDPARADFQP